jgi:subtilase family serine protease
MERHWTRPHSEASASRCEVRFPASSPYALACGGTAHAAAGRVTVGTVIPDFNVGYTYQKTDPRILPLFWNCLTFSDGLLTVYEVAREFEFNSLRHAVWQVGDYRCRTTKSALLTMIILYATRGGPR